MKHGQEHNPAEAWLSDLTPRGNYLAQEAIARWPDPITFGLSGPGFGDVWKSVQFAHHVRRQQGTRVRLYACWHGWPGEKFSWKPLADRADLAREIDAVLDVSTPLEIVTDTPPDEVRCLLGRWPWHFALIPTRLRWQGWSHGRLRRLSYQLDGDWSAAAKNPPPEDVARLLNWAPGHEMVQLGARLSVQQCLEVAASSDLFFGVDSGMIQLCYAVGVPVFLIGYRMAPEVLFTWHGNRHAIHCAGTEELIIKARSFLGLCPAVVEAALPAQEVACST